MSNRAVGLVLLTIGVEMLAGTFGLGVLAFLNRRQMKWKLVDEYEDIFDSLFQIDITDWKEIEALIGEFE